MTDDLTRRQRAEARSRMIHPSTGRYGGGDQPSVPGDLESGRDPHVESFEEWQVRGRVQVYVWDWKDQPPLSHILAGAKEMSASGPWFFFEPGTGTDSYAVVIADRDLTPAELDQVMKAP